MEGDISEPSRLITVVEALNEKYSEENCTCDDFAHIQITSRQGARVSFQHEKREIVALDGCGITSAGEPGEIEAICPFVSELDITNNQIKEWNEVFKIISELKNLRFLNLCGNPLNGSSYSSMLHINNMESSAFDSLAELVLNNTNVPISTVQQLLKALPSVEELHLSLNGYATVPECEDSFETVKRLHFNGNNIKDWEEVEKLGKMFPNLQTLVFMENPLTGLQRNDKDTLVSLKTLCLTKTMLNRWEDIDALRNFISLKEVKLIGIPLVAQFSEDEARKLLVARLPNVDCLNGSCIMSNERDTAGRYFVRRYQDEEDPPGRYHELLAIHGELIKLADVNLDPVNVANIMLHITGRAPRLEKISVTQTSSDFRKFLSKMVELPVKKFRVHYRDVGSPYETELMRSSSRKLHAYGVKDGDEIYVEILE